jgi:hypothetical protein
MSAQNLLSAKPETQAIIAATTITKAQSGVLFTLGTNAGAYVITLPTVADAAGCRFKFLLTGTLAAGAVTISSNAANIKGVVMGRNAAIAAIASVTSIILGVNLTNGGDVLELYSNGTNYFASGIFQTAAEVTTA